MLERSGAMLHIPANVAVISAGIAWQSPDVGQSVFIPEVDDLYAGHYRALLAEATFRHAWLKHLAPIFRAISDTGEPLVQSGGAHSLTVTSREEHDLLPQHTDTAPVMHTVTPGRDTVLDQAKVLAKYLRAVSRRMAGRVTSSDEECALGYANGVTAIGCLRPVTRLLPFPSLEVKPILSGLYLQKSWTGTAGATDKWLAQGVNHLWLDVQ